MEKLILSENEIQSLVAKVGGRITADYKGCEKPPVIICVMNGAMAFCADLLKRVDLDVVFDYIQVKSWSGTKSTGQIQMVKDISTDIKGRDVLLVEDIVDTGHSMLYLTKYLQEKYQPKTLKICAFFDKPSGRQVELKAHYVGYELKGNEFLVGYGLDYNGLGRNIPYVFVPSKDQIEAWDKANQD